MKKSVAHFVAPVAGSVCLWSPEIVLLDAGTPLAPLGFLDAAAAYPLFLIAATLAVLLLIGVRPQALRVSRSLTAAAAVLYAGGTAASCCCLFAPAAATAFAASGVADLVYFGGLISAGLGFGVLMISWGSFYVDIPLRSTWIVILAVAFAQPLIMVLLSLAPLLWVVLPCMPLVSLGCLRTSLSRLPAFGHEKPRLAPRSISIRPAYVIGIASISFCFGVLKFLGLTTGVTLSALEGLTVDLFAAAALVVLFRRGEHGYSLAWRIIGFIMLIGLALLLVLQQNLLSSAFTVVALGYGIFEYALWIATVDLAKYAQSAPLRFLGLTFAFTIGGQGVGALATLAVPPAFATTPLILVALVITAAAIIWLLPAEAVQTLFAPVPPLQRGSNTSDAAESAVRTASNDAETPNGSAHEQAPSEREVRMTLLKESCGLTNREAEIALLLAGGRSARFIQEELVISEGTTWTHIRHIYQKLGVSSRQEFLTAIEEVLPQ